MGRDLAVAHADPLTTEVIRHGINSAAGERQGV